MDDEQYRNWVNRDLEPQLHREAYRHVLRESGLTDEHAEALYGLLIDPANWTVVPGHRRGARQPAPAGHQDRRRVRTSRSTSGPRSRRSARPTTSTSSCCPSKWARSSRTPEIFPRPWSRLGVGAADTLMVGDSDEADGGAVAGAGVRFALVEPLPTNERPDGLIRRWSRGSPSRLETWLTRTSNRRSGSNP